MWSIVARSVFVSVVCLVRRLTLHRRVAPLPYPPLTSQLEEQFRLVESERRVKAASRAQSQKRGKHAKQAAPHPSVSNTPSSAADDDGAGSVATPGSSSKSLQQQGDAEDNGDNKALVVASPGGNAPAAAAAGALAIAQPSAGPLHALTTTDAPRRKAAAVDATFVKRMAFILRIVVPSITSKEVGLCSC